MAWIPVTERLPRQDMPYMLWGDKLEAGLDHPLAGVLCACHDEWVLDLSVFAEVNGKEVDHQEYVRRMLGNVTHWLEWEPAPGG